GREPVAGFQLSVGDELLDLADDFLVDTCRFDGLDVHESPLRPSGAGAPDHPRDATLARHSRTDSRRGTRHQYTSRTPSRGPSLAGMRAGSLVPGPGACPRRPISSR